MMHHPNIHHQNMSGHPGPQHLPAHQGIPGHHQMPPHQMHRDQNRLGMSGSMSGSGMALGQPLGMLHQHQQGPPHPHQGPSMRHHRPPPMHHSQHMQPMRRPFICGTTPSVLQQRPPQPIHTTQMHHNLRPIQQQSTIAHQPQILSKIHHMPPTVNPIDTRPLALGPADPPAAPTKSDAPDSEKDDEQPLTNGSAPEISNDDLNTTNDEDTVTAGVANSKEKTPMCLVNELARFNKIKHQYRLTRESGPAHKKRFTVALRLGAEGEAGAEEYAAEGGSIKRAQHAAAAEALRRTALPPPPRRPPAWRRRPPLAGDGAAFGDRQRGAAGSIMPTVELNALAMKLCQPAVYRAEPPVPLGGPRAPPFRCPGAGPPPGAGPAGALRPWARGPAGGPGGFARAEPPLLHRVRLEVGARRWRGEGPTSQAARHAAAAAALRDLRAADTAAADAPAADDDADDADADLKSPVSLVHEMALKRNLSVRFKVDAERGPPHMKVFVTSCAVGELRSEGEGNGKRASKRRAAEAMVTLMRETLPPAPARRAGPAKAGAAAGKRRASAPKRRARNLIKEGAEGAAAAAEADAAPNPISVLAVRQAWRRARSPQYRVLEERGAARRRSFLVECVAPLGPTATGHGPNKKAAKRDAAHKVLVAMGVDPAEAGSARGSPTRGGGGPERAEEEGAAAAADGRGPEGARGPDESRPAPGGGATGPGGRQPVPGLLLMRDGPFRSAPAAAAAATGAGVDSQATASIAKDLLRACSSPSAEPLPLQSSSAHVSSPVSNPISSPVISSTSQLGNSPTRRATVPTATDTSATSQQAIRPKDQLLYLADLLGFQVQFSDFPKGNHGEYLSLVTLSTSPAVLCHGGGASTERSHDQSARAALDCLARMGLDNLSPAPPDNPKSETASDGLPVNPDEGSPKSGLLANGLNK